MRLNIFISIKVDLVEISGMAGMNLCSVLCFLSLTITKSLQYDIKVLKTGSVVELSCEDEDPIHWCYPPISKPPNDLNDLKIVYGSPTDMSYSYIRKHKITLRITNVTYVYTGYYHCVKNDSKMPCERRMENALKSTYLYVEDPEQLLVVSGYKDFVAYRNEELILPCYPTSPEVHLSLSLAEEELALGIQEYSDMVISYDPTLGFSLNPFNTVNAGDYLCNATNGKSSSSLSINVGDVIGRVKYLMPPTIYKDGHEITHQVVREGDTLILDCKSLQKKDLRKYDLIWKIPSYVKYFKNDNNCRDSNYACRRSVVTIPNFSYSYQDKYICEVSSGNLEPKNDSVQIHVIGKTDEGINLTSTWDKSKPVLRGTNPMQIVVDVKAPGDVNMTWYGPDDQQINHDSKKYNVYISSFNTLLKVHLVTLHDAGSYKLKVFDKVSEKWFNTSVIIQDKPEVVLNHPNKLFQLNKNVTFLCEVYSPPPVNITWVFEKCDLHDLSSCAGNGSSVLKKLNFTNVLHNKPYTSQLKFNIQEGILQCIANNTCKGTTNKKYCGQNSSSVKTYITDMQELQKTLSIFGEPEEIIIGDNVTLTCGASSYFYKGFPVWYESGKALSNSSGMQITTSKSSYSWYSNLTFFNVTKELNRIPFFVCYGYSSHEFESKKLIVLDPLKPSIYQTNMKKTIEVKQSDSIYLSCKARGTPRPSIEWYKDNKPLVNNVRGIEINPRNQSLLIKVVTLDHEGSYQCVAKNKISEDKRTVELVITDKPGSISAAVVVTIAILVFVLIGLIVFLVLKIRKEKHLQRELNLAGLANFEKGALESINPELSVDEQADLLPYDKAWEFPKDKLKIGKQLGAGAFGVVMKAEAYGILDDEEKTTVAVKMVKSGADKAFVKALASELKIMAHLGKHLNVVNLLGASTKNLARMELMVIVEYCRYGNLHNYLLRHRDYFIDQVDHTTGEINLSIGIEKLSRSQSSKSKTNLKHRLLSYSSSLIGMSNSAGSNADPHTPSSPIPTEITGIASDMSVVSSPTGEVDECLLSSGSTDQPEWRVKYTGDYGDSSIRVCTQNLLCWAFQIARGMEYLASRKVMHGDLAARNVLLADDNIVKICDFGLAKSMYKSDNYKKKGGGPMPVKWMALESIRDRIFSTQSDVWSFGIVLWELFSLARTPYPGMEADERLYQKLLNGYRMEHPDYAPNVVYKTMLKCWQGKPNNRPTFMELTDELGAMLDDNLRRHFEDLNDPYVSMNNQRGENSDYLNMMGAPDYHNMIAPTGDDYINSSHPSGSEPGYLNMKSPSLNGSVFEFAPEDASAVGYLRMSGKDNIFSPRLTDDSLFKYAPGTPKETRIQMQPLKQTNPPKGDHYVNVPATCSVSNPGYIMTKSEE